MFQRLAHAAIRVSDLEKALDFYCRVVGLTEHFRLHDDQDRLMLVYLQVTPGQFVELFPGGQAPYDPGNRAGLIHLCLEVDDIQSAYQEMIARGATPLHGEPTLEADHTWQFWLADPDGNPIEFHQYTTDSLQHTQPRSS
jgi:catechol 2,3-dioxygenase-like lactoylglutathione lyase family enzyme